MSSSDRSNQKKKERYQAARAQGRCVDCLIPIRRFARCEQCRIIRRAKSVVGSVPPRKLSNCSLYAGEAYAEMREVRDWSPRQAVEYARDHYDRLAVMLTDKQIRISNLDNPFMAEHARRLLVSEALRLSEKIHHTKQRVLRRAA